jgi:hypothetical protein
VENYLAKERQLNLTRSSKRYDAQKEWESSKPKYSIT